MHKSKRGQVTLFVVLAIIIVVAIGIVVVTQTNITKPAVSAEEGQKIVAAQAQPIKDFIVQCTEQPVKDSIVKIGLQGGYCSPMPVKSSQVGNYNLPYLALLSGQSNLLMLEGAGHTIASEAVICIDMSQIAKCIDNFNSFKKILDVKEEGRMNITLNFILPKTIAVEILYPVSLTKGDAKTLIDKSDFQFESGLLEAYDTAHSIVASEIVSHDFDIDAYDQQNVAVSSDRQGASADTVYYYLSTNPLNGEEIYHFNFAVEREAP